MTSIRDANSMNCDTESTINCRGIKDQKRVVAVVGELGDKRGSRCRQDAANELGKLDAREAKVRSTFLYL